MSIRNGREAYKSPIETIWSDIERDYGKQFDQMVLTAVQCVGVRVNKEELVKALAYDRGQYRKGWEDRDSEIVRCRDCRYYGDPFGPDAGADSERWCFLLGLVGAFDKDDYCSHGERRKDGVDY